MALGRRVKKCNMSKLFGPILQLPPRKRERGWGVYVGGHLFAGLLFNRLTSRSGVWDLGPQST